MSKETKVNHDKKRKRKIEKGTTVYFITSVENQLVAASGTVIRSMSAREAMEQGFVKRTKRRHGGTVLEIDADLGHGHRKLLHKFRRKVYLHPIDPPKHKVNKKEEYDDNESALD